MFQPGAEDPHRHWPALGSASRVRSITLKASLKMLAGELKWLVYAGFNVFFSDDSDDRAALEFEHRSQLNMSSWKHIEGKKADDHVQPYGIIDGFFEDGVKARATNQRISLGLFNHLWKHPDQMIRPFAAWPCLPLK